MPDHLAADQQYTRWGGLLPSGVVTFLFSDIEGSTRLLQRLGADYRALLEEHRGLLRAAVEANGGTIVDYQGDGIFAAFADARGGVQAAVAAQRMLAAHSWPPGAPVAVRIGLHAGPAEPVDGNYIALAVHQAARVSAAAHGGQTVISAAVAEAVSDRLPDIGLTALGDYHLKDFDGPQALHQVSTPSLDGTTHPPLRTPRAITSQVTTDRTPFVGRTFDRIAVQSLLDRERLVTLVGPGGVGKSRLARKVAVDRTADHAGGIWPVSLSGVSDDAGVAGAVAVVLEVTPGADDLMTAVMDRLRGTDALLLLDGGERVVAGVGRVVQAVLGSCPDVRVLVTSREPLGLSGEWVQRIDPLVLPPVGAEGVEEIRDHEAVQFFVTHAERARPGFVLDASNAAAVAALCRRLDGLPLALRLAAARLRVLSPSQLLERLDASFRALGTGDRDDPEHHRTLSAAIAWSYDALPALEQVVFARLGALPDGGSLEAVEATCAGGEVERHDVLDALAVLAQRSLVSVSGDATPRWRMLDTVRAFAQARLVESGEHAAALGRYGSWLATYVESESLADPESCARVDAEATALRTMLDPRHVLPTTTVHRLIAATGGYWLMRSIREGRDLVLPHLDRDDGSVPERVAAIIKAAALCRESDDLDRGRSITALAVELARSTSDRSLEARALTADALFYQRSDPQHALTLLMQALAAAESEGDIAGQALVHSRVAVTGHELHDWELARRSNLAALALFRQLKSARSVAVTLFNLAELDVDENPAEALRAVSESVEITGSLGDRFVQAHALALRGRISLTLGDVTAARSDLAAAADLHTAVGNDNDAAEVRRELAALPVLPT